MKLSEAWRALARDFDECRRGRRRYEAGAWLCNQLQFAGPRLGITEAQDDKMVKRIQTDCELRAALAEDANEEHAYTYGHGAEANAARVLVCLMFACEAEDAGQ